MTRREVLLARMFAHLDAKGVGGTTAVAAVDLCNRDVLTVRAGGPGIHSRPGAGPFDGFEVLLDHEPARFWDRFHEDEEGVLYADVPRLCLAHHIIRRGGIAALIMETQVRTSVAALSVVMTVDPGVESVVLETLSHLDGVQLVGSHLNPSKYLQTGV
jgi:hypothetical protein